MKLKEKSSNEKYTIIYNKDDTTAKTLNAFTSILIVAVLNNSITVESNNPYIYTKHSIKL